MRIDLEFKPEGHLGREYFRLGEAELTRKQGRYRQERALLMELLDQYNGLKRMIAVRFGDLE
jgi:hypothetical protein